MAMADALENFGAALSAITIDLGNVEGPNR